MTTQLQQVAGFNAQDLITVNNDQLVTTSLQVAEVFGKQHKHVLEKIAKLDCSGEFASANFSAHVNSIAVGNGARRDSKVFRITKDGFMFLVMGFTGKKAAAIKEQYINAFNWMADRLHSDPVKYLMKVQYFNQPVVTFEMIDQAHGRIKGHTSKRFYGRNKSQFIEKQDFYRVPYSERQILDRFGIQVHSSGVVLLTRSGYDKLTAHFAEFGVDHTRDCMFKNYFDVGRTGLQGVPDKMLIQALRLCTQWLSIQQFSPSDQIKVSELFNWRQEMDDFSQVLQGVSLPKDISWDGAVKYKQAFELLNNRVALERNLSLSREDYMSANLTQQARELAWAKHWQLLN